jgi:hypothetical protein
VFVEGCVLHLTSVDEAVSAMGLWALMDGVVRWNGELARIASVC